MVIKLILLAASVALVRASPDVPTVAFGYPSPLTFLQYVDKDKNDSKTDASPQTHADPIVIAVYDFHKTFLDKLRVKPPYHYSFGFECYDWKKDASVSQYEARYGDVAVGTHVYLAPGGGRTTVDYTVDSNNGFYGGVHRDFLSQPVELGFARLAGPVAFTSHALKGESASRGTPLADPVTNPLVIAAYFSHDFFVKYFNLEPPFRYSFGYELKDSQSGITRSQYETYYGEEGEGSFTQVEVNGTKSGIDYSIRPQGFAFVTSSRNHVNDVIPLVYATALGYTNLHY